MKKVPCREKRPTLQFCPLETEFKLRNRQKFCNVWWIFLLRIWSCDGETASCAFWVSQLIKSSFTIWRTVLEDNLRFRNSPVFCNFETSLCLLKKGTLSCADFWKISWWRLSFLNLRKYAWIRYVNIDSRKGLFAPMLPAGSPILFRRNSHREKERRNFPHNCPNSQSCHLGYFLCASLWFRCGLLENIMVDAFLYAHAPVCFGEGNIVFIMQRCCYLLPISGGKKMNGTLSILSKICAIYQLADIFIAHLGAYVAIFIFQHAFQGSRNGLSLYRIQCNRFNSIIIQLLFILPFLACLSIHVIIKSCWSWIKKFDLLYLRERFSGKHAVGVHIVVVWEFWMSWKVRSDFCSGGYSVSCL